MSTFVNYISGLPEIQSSTVEDISGLPEVQSSTVEDISGKSEIKSAIGNLYFINTDISPEQIAEVNGVIAVCNSGYGYGNTLSMIDVNSFSVKKELALPHMNPQDIVVCNDKFYCNTTEYDEFWNSVSRIIEVDPVTFGTKEIAEAFYMCPVGEQLFMIKQSTNYYTTPYTYENTFSSYDTKTGKVTEGKKDETGTFKLYDRGIYGMFCSPDQKKLYVCVSNQEGSAYVNSDVFVFDLSGKQLDQFKTGVLTSKVCFAK